MHIALTFFIAFAFSFVGSIPPGTLNLTILQLGLNNQIRLAWRFALAAALVEYPYAWIAVKFADLITTSPIVMQNIKIISAVVMLSVGILSLWNSRRPTSFTKKFEQSGFRRGLVLSILNPMAIPFWIAVTAYLTAQGWIDLSKNSLLHGYLIGISIGTLLLLIVLAHLASKLVNYVRSDSWVKSVPGITLTALGLYALGSYIFYN